MNGITAETTNYYYNGSVLMAMQAGNTVQRFSYDAQGNAIAVDYSDNGGSSYTTYYYILNAQGDIVKLVDGNCNTVVEYTYDSWGKILAVTGSLATSLGRNQPFRYRGYVYDTETQWYYLQSRYYDPATCRFISSDVYLSTGQGVLGHNSYAYCLNNSVNAEDPTGFWSWFSSGKGRRDDADAGWYGGSSGFGGFVRRISYNNRNSYSSGHSSSHSNRYTSGTKATASGFRAGLQKLTGQSGENMDAHHVFPQKFSMEFWELKINIHESKYGSWVEPHIHRAFSYDYNKDWEGFLHNPTKPPTKAGALSFAREMAGKYGFNIWFEME